MVGSAVARGGVSQVFGQPAYQRTLPTRGRESFIYLSFLRDAGWYFIGGTSEGAPQWADTTVSGLRRPAGLGSRDRLRIV